MFNIGGGEMVVLAILALLVFGPEGLPDILRTVARTVKAFKTAANDFQSEVNTALTLEQQKREVAERRRKRTLPEPASPGPVEAATTALAASAPLESADDAAADDPIASDMAARVGDPVPESTAPAAETSVAVEAPVSAGTEAASSLDSQAATSANPEVAASVDSVAAPVEDEIDDDGPGLPMTRPAPASAVSGSEQEPAESDETEKTSAAGRPNTETV